MLKKTITYTDYNGNTRTDDFYFNLSQAEVTEWELRENLKGGLGVVLQSVIGSNDGNQIMDTFRLIIEKSYGIKSQDGRSFIKSQEISSGFMGSEAYSQIFMELMMNPGTAADFINGIIPAAALEASAEKMRQQQGARPRPMDHQEKNIPTRQVPQPQPFSQAGFPADAQPFAPQPKDIEIQPAQTVFGAEGQDLPATQPPTWTDPETGIKYTQKQPAPAAEVTKMWRDPESGKHIILVPGTEPRELTEQELANVTAGRGPFNNGE